MIKKTANTGKQAQKFALNEVPISLQGTGRYYLVNVPVIIILCRQSAIVIVRAEDNQVPDGMSLLC